MLSRSFRRAALVGLAATGLLAGLFVPAGLGVTAAGAASGSPITVPVISPALTDRGTVNLSKLGGTAAPRQARTASQPREVDNQVLSHRPQGTGSVSVTPNASVTRTNVRGESGFLGISGQEQAVANGGVDLEPPDQGLCAGNGYVGEFINSAFTVYQRDGAQQLPVIPSYELFKQPSNAFLSDPRCYYDASTQRWFLISFSLAIFGRTGPSLQFIDVSNTSDPTGTYTVWSFSTTDKGRPGCPCFGDYDILGADANGFYIATDEFGVNSNAFYGAVVYAVSKTAIETFAQTTIPPVLFGYRLGTKGFGATEFVSPTTTPQGAQYAPNTEYFVESNPTKFSDDHLAVFALNDTSLLAQPAPPSFYLTTVKTQGYAFPPDASQAPGPIPLGKSVQDPLGQLQADFDAVMQTTYTGGNIYAELDTATTGGNAAAWFILTPTLSSGTLTATVAHQGYVSVNGANLIYPAIGVNAGGNGYMTFTLSGAKNHPSSAYVAFAPSGAFGSVHVAFAGAGTEDSFTCYAAFVGPNYGGCRWGDYSAAVASGGRVYMATETVPGTARDYLTNWGTFVFSAPPQPPPPAG